MVLWIGEILSIIKSAVVIVVAVAVTILLVRVLMVAFVVVGDPLSVDTWTSDEMKDWANPAYWRDAIVWSLGGWAVFIGAVVVLVCALNSCGGLGRCLMAACCAHGASAPPVQVVPAPNIQLIMAPAAPSTGADAV